MLEKYFCAPKTLRRLRDGISGPHIDAFADRLERDGYAPASAVRYIRSAAHLGCFVQRKGSFLTGNRVVAPDSGHAVLIPPLPFSGGMAASINKGIN